MEASPQTAGEIVMVGIKDVAPDEFRQRLAQAIGAEWTSKNGVWRLTRSAKQENEQIAAERLTRVKEIAEGMQIITAARSTTPPFDQAAANRLAGKLAALYDKYKGHLSDAGGLQELIPLQAQMPEGRLASAILARLSPEQIADVGPGDRIVFSTSPTRMQRPLPGDVQPAVIGFLAELEMFDKAIKDQKLAGESFASRFGMPFADSTEEGSSLLVALARSPYNNSLTVDVHLVGKSGKYVATSRTLLDLPKKAGTTTLLAEGKIALSDQAARFNRAIQGFQKGETFLKDRVLLEEMKYPEKTDPLSYISADGVFNLAKSKNFVACIPDDGFMEPAFTAVEKDGSLNLANFSRWITDHELVDQTDRWFVLTPKAPNAVRNQRADRTILGPFFRNAIAAGGASLDGMAEFAASMPRRYTDSLVPMLAFFLLPDLNVGITDRNVEMLRIYGRLNLENRHALLGGKAQNFGLLNEASRADIADLVFRADSPIGIMSRSPVPAPVDGVFRGSLQSEVTYVFANGIPNGAGITLYSRQETAVIADGGTSPSSMYAPLSAGQLGMMLAMAEKADPSDPRTQVKIDKFRYGSTVRYNFNLSLSETVSIGADVQANHFDRSGDALTYEQLPADFRAEVDKARAQARQTQKNIPAATTKTPPPR